MARERPYDTPKAHFTRIRSPAVIPTTQALLNNQSTNYWIWIAGAAILVAYVYSKP